MNLHARRLSALSVAALTTLAIGVGTGTASNAATGKGDHARTAAGTTAKGAYQQLAKGKKNKDMVRLDLLAFNDFHGNLEQPGSGSSGKVNGTTAGGATNLAHALHKQRKISRANGAKPLTVAAGDLIGASPLLSGAFHDEPTIEAMNKIHLDVSAVGNHEFDEGPQELQRMADGGCLDDGDGANGQDSCPGGKDFEGADFGYLAANVTWADSAENAGDRILPATDIMKVKGEKVAFIGMTLEGTPEMVTKSAVKDLAFADEVETANALVPKLQKRGVESIVVLLHEGIEPGDTTAYNDCTDPDGPALTIAQELDPAIDAVVSGHTHLPYNCTVEDPAGQPRLLTSSSSFGRMITKLHFLIDPKTHDIVRPAAYAQNMIVEADPDKSYAPKLAAMIGEYKALVADFTSQVIGHIDGADSVTRDPDADGLDSPLGNLIADGQKADGSVVDGTHPAPVIALMNPGGIRSDLLENENGDVTYGAAFSVQPFNNSVVSMDLTGAQIKEILNQQWNGSNEGANPKILQVSGLTYTWDESDAALPDAGALVGDVMVDADGDASTPMVPMEDGTTYRVVANNYLSDGGDGFTVFADGLDKLTGGLDIDSLRKYLEANDPTPIPATDRISSVD